MHRVVALPQRLERLCVALLAHRGLLAHPRVAVVHLVARDVRPRAVVRAARRRVRVAVPLAARFQVTQDPLAPPAVDLRLLRIPGLVLRRRDLRAEPRVGAALRVGILLRERRAVVARYGVRGDYLIAARPAAAAAAADAAVDVGISVLRAKINCYSGYSGGDAKEKNESDPHRFLVPTTCI